MDVLAVTITRLEKQNFDVQFIHPLTQKEHIIHCTRDKDGRYTYQKAASPPSPLRTTDENELLGFIIFDSQIPEPVRVTFTFVGMFEDTNFSEPSWKTHDFIFKRPQASYKTLTFYPKFYQ